MSDIIQVAQDLQSEFNNERQDWLRERGGESIEMPLDCTVLYGDEEARDVIGALAEETWEYSFHVQNTIGMWEHPTPWAGETGKWWETKEDAEESALAAHEYGYPIRIVRRRVSPPEVCE